ncbi:hypothetical protein [Parapedobacter sp. 2B3]|uniref:hypothetical protein n=1 Tax=Parapedobacter sp. 2B3 TaxID=3342381 RepID=UPI0035B6A573
MSGILNLISRILIVVVFSCCGSETRKKVESSDYHVSESTGPISIQLVKSEDVINDVLIKKEGKEIKLSDIILANDSVRLIFRYADIHCNVCIDSVLVGIKKIAEEIGGNNIKLFASYKNERDLWVWQRLNNIRFEVFEIPEHSLITNLDKMNTPYLFILLPGRYKAYDIFVPKKENQMATLKYLEFIQKKYFAVSVFQSD